jgi:hypothetical protein
MGGLLRSLELNVENQGMFERFVQMQSRQTGQPPAQVRQMMELGATLGLPAVLGKGPSGQAVYNAVVQFLKAPKQVHLSAKAKQDFTIQEMGAAPNAGVWLEKMEVRAQANP